MPRKSGRFLKEDFICMDSNFEFIEIKEGYNNIVFRVLIVCQGCLEDFWKKNN